MIPSIIVNHLITSSMLSVDTSNLIRAFSVDLSDNCYCIIIILINFANGLHKGYLNVLVQELVFFRNITGENRITLAWKI